MLYQCCACAATDRASDTHAGGSGEGLRRGGKPLRGFLVARPSDGESSGIAAPQFN
ncbi:hypothetical protein GS506_06520 [Rhodococcus hoagii]|nr:hypothetical protein [Prescottella equi]